MRLKRSDKLGGFSLLEAAFGAAIVGVFFVALFGLNSQCLYFVNSSRELSTAGQTAQSRLEQLRNCTWQQITDRNYIRNSILNTPADGGALSLGTLTEVVTINKYTLPASSGTPTPAPSPAILVTRVGDSAGGGTVTFPSPTPNSAITSPSADMWTINLQLTWTVAPAARSRTMAVSTIYGKNTQ